jgi:hypothetical protein
LLCCLCFTHIHRSNNKSTAESFWTNGTPMSTVRTESPLLSWKKIYLCYRRFDKSGVATNIVEAYNINNNSWNEATPLPP